MITYRLGNGLPSSITPRRVKNILAFAKSQEREFEGALNHTGEKNPADIGIYERIQSLLQSAAGRTEYGKAQNFFEQTKPKRQGRADFFLRLKKDCLKSLTQQDLMSPSTDNVYTPNSEPQDLYLAFARINAWQKMAEYIWAQCVESDTGDDIANALKQYPQLSQFLSEVGISHNFKVNESNEIDEQLSRELPGEAEELVKTITDASQSLEPSRLNSKLLTQMIGAANRLATISAIRQAKKETSNVLKSCIVKWKKRNFEGISNTPELAERIAKLESMTEFLEISVDELKLILTNLQKLIDITQNKNKLIENCRQALDNSDFKSVGSINNELKKLECEASADLNLIDKELEQLSLITSATPVFTQLSDTRSMIASSSDDALHSDHKNKIKKGDSPRDELNISSVDTTSEVAIVSPVINNKNNTTDSLEKNTSEDVAVPTTKNTLKKIDSDAEFNTQIRKTISKEISKGRYAFAYYLAQAEPSLFPTPNMIKLIAANYVHPHSYQLISDYGAIADNITKEFKSASYPAAYDMALIASAALKPARMSTGAPVAQLLGYLRPFLKKNKSFCRIIRKVEEVSLKGIQLNSVLFSQGNKEGHWKVSIQDLFTETKDWLAQRKLQLEQGKTSKYKPARDVWWYTLVGWESDEIRDNDLIFIGSFMSKFQLGSSSGMTNVDNIVDNINTNETRLILDLWHRDIERKIDQIDRKCRQTTRFKPIEEPARKALRSKICEALDLINRWCNLIDARPRNYQTPNYHLRLVEELRQVVEQHWQQATREILKLNSVYTHRIKDLLHRYVAFFGLEVDVPAIPDLKITDLLYGDLLADHEFELDKNTEMTLDRDSLSRILFLATQEELDYKRSAINKAKSNDFYGAEDTLDFALRAGRISEIDEEEARRAIDEEKGRSIGKLTIEIENVNASLVAAYAQGVIPTGDFYDLQAGVPSDDDLLDSDFRQISSKLKLIDEAVRKFKIDRSTELKKELEERVKRLARPLDREDKERINSAISKGRYLVAENFIESLASDRGIQGLSDEQDRPFDRFFPNFLDEYMELYKSKGKVLEAVYKAIKHRNRLGPIDARNLLTPEVSDSLALLESWRSMVDGGLSEQRVQQYFSSLGFSKPILSEFTESNDLTKALIKTDIIADKKVCQLPEFGSMAEGRYTVLVIKNPENKKKIEGIEQEIEILEKSVRTPSVIVLFLNYLDSSERRILASQFAFGRHKPVLVLDEVLVVFLALELRSRRLRALFDCASAFSFASPYNPDEASVPPEMFFGRTNVRRSISSHSEASHLVYGGRRLGKTALLKNIELESKPNQRSEMILYLDLNSTGISRERPVNGIWKIIATRLYHKYPKQLVFLKNLNTVNSIQRKLENWIMESQRRRVLILLDEADNFLESDRGHKYPVLLQIKGLMDRTQRKFKVVFSGLHNVQRSSRDPNSPLVHLGTPIPIGPMLLERDGLGSSADRNAIVDLIRRPLGALGYRFMSDDDVMHVAIETNGYPALAQQFCKELLNHLREGSFPSKDKGPPYEIPTKAIQHVFDSKETRDKLQAIFSWTIRLDPRYEFLTYLIARQNSRDLNSRTSGVSLSEIREIALAEGPPNVFSKDSSYFAFEILLDEMIGLGVLRETGTSGSVESLGGRGKSLQDPRFSIRTRSLHALLGNEADIDRNYEDSKERNLSTLNDPWAFRRTLGDVEISPLTAGQEWALLLEEFNVGLVFGTKLSGIEDVYRSLCQAAQEVEDAPQPMNVKEDELFSKLSAISRNSQQSNLVLVVRLHKTLELKVIGQVKEKVDRLYKRSRNKRVRVIFLCGPALAWSWLRQNTSIATGHGVNFGLKVTWLCPCSVDFAHLWLKENEIDAFSELQDKDFSPKPWPVVLSFAAKSKHTSLRAAEVEALNGDLDLTSDVLEIPCVDKVLGVLSDLSSETIDDILYMLTEDHSGEGFEESYHLLAVEEGDKSEMDILKEVIYWAERLGVVNKVGEKYKLDSTYLNSIRSIAKK